MLDAIFRSGYRLAFHVLRTWWRVRSPSHRGALVALWHGERLLLVRTSYRPYWALPGGGIERSEGPRAAAVRELHEELGLSLDEAALVPASTTEHFWNHRRDHVTLFEVQLQTAPPLRIDHREIVDARWFTRDELAQCALPPHSRTYVAQRGIDAPLAEE